MRCQKGVCMQWGSPSLFHCRNACQNSRQNGRERKNRGKNKTVLAISKLAGVTLCHLAACWLPPSDVILQQAGRDGWLRFLLTFQGSCLVGTKWKKNICLTPAFSKPPATMPACPPGSPGRHSHPWPPLHGIPGQDSYGSFLQNIIRTEKNESLACTFCINTW